MNDTGWRLEPATDCNGRTADHPDWATCCHHKGCRRYSLTECTRDDSCRVPSHWQDPKYSGPHRDPAARAVLTEESA